MIGTNVVSVLSADIYPCVKHKLKQIESKTTINYQSLLLYESSHFLFIIPSKFKPKRFNC